MRIKKTIMEIKRQRNQWLVSSPINNVGLFCLFLRLHIREIEMFDDAQQKMLMRIKVKDDPNEIVIFLLCLSRIQRSFSGNR